MSSTTNYNLNKPTYGTRNWDIPLNQNFDVIDSTMKSIDDKINSHKADFVSVKQFGAKGDGVANDTTAIQSAVDYLAANGLNVLFFPAGVYRVSGIVNNSRIAFIGADIQNTVIKGIDATTPIITYNNDISFIRLENITLDREVVAISGGHGIYTTASGMGFHIENLFIKNQYDGIHLEGDIAGGYLLNSYVTNCVRDGVSIAHGNMTIFGVYSIFNGGSGFKFYKSTGGLYLTRCEAFSNGGNGITLSAENKAGGDTINDVIISQCSIGLSKGNGIYLDTNGENINISDCYIEYSGHDETGTAISAKEGILVTAANKRVDINNCQCLWNAGAGITIYANGVKINGGIYAINSLFLNNASPGILISENVLRTTIIGVSSCKYEGDAASTQSFGISVLSGANEYTIIGCDVKGNGLGTIYVDPAAGKNGNIKDCRGFNPVGALTAPALPATGVPLVNPFPYTVDVYIYGGTVVAINKNDVQITGMGSGVVRLEPNERITIAYSVAPNWTWYGL